MTDEDDIPDDQSRTTSQANLQRELREAKRKRRCCSCWLNCREIMEFEPSSQEQLYEQLFDGDEFLENPFDGVGSRSYNQKYASGNQSDLSQSG